MKKISIETNQIEEFGKWLEEKLFFKRIKNEAFADNSVYENGDCLLELCSMETIIHEKAYKGFVHIALDSTDINAALRYCKKENLLLELKGEDIFLNPKVYGEGAYYFNILSPFGITFEVSQKKGDARKAKQPVIAGLNHVGLQAKDIVQAVAYYKQEGFQNEFEIVTNEDAQGNMIRVVMMKKENIIIEIFQIGEMLQDNHNQRIFIKN